jgi:hypothetical protein
MAGFKHSHSGTFDDVGAAAALPLAVFVIGVADVFTIFATLSVGVGVDGGADEGVGGVDVDGGRAAVVRVANARQDTAKRRIVVALNIPRRDKKL